MVADQIPDYLTIREAAEYLGVSTQTLRRWDESGKLRPVRHPQNGYRYYRRADLEPYRLEYRRAEMTDNPIGAFFCKVPANIEANPLLREPQRELHRRMREHFSKSNAPALAQIPVGCGKTGGMAILPFGIAKGRVLVITPNVTIRSGVAAALDITNPTCFFFRTKVLPMSRHGPFCAVLDGADANIHDCTGSHFVVTNIQQLASAADRWLPQFPPDFFDMILVDESHHNVAASWRKVFLRFPQAKVIGLTATPFRSDGQKPDGELIYRYPFHEAMQNGFIKQIDAVNVAPAEITFTFAGEARRHTLDEVLALREEQWFRRGVALAPECNRHIAEASVNRLARMRAKTGVQHQLIASACSVDHARQVRSIYEECGLAAREIHSDMDTQDQESVFDGLRSGHLDAVVQVQMLGEGFDHPSLSVAAVFRPYRSLSPFIQFVGRIMRVIHEGQAGHPDNHGYVVSHIGLNNDARWNDFREVDLEDQALFKEWLFSEGMEEREDPGTGEGKPRRFDIGMRVQNEIISHFLHNPFLDPSDDRVLDKMLKQEVAPGVALSQLVDRDKLRAQLMAVLAERKMAPQPLPVQPQRKRVAVRGRVAERSNAVVGRVLQELGLDRGGRDLLRLFPGRGGANVAIATREFNSLLNKRAGLKKGQRGAASQENLDRAMGMLDMIGDELVKVIRTKQEIKNGEGAKLVKPRPGRNRARKKNL